MSKSMSLSSRIEMLNSIRSKYHAANKNEKHQLLDNFVAATGYERKYSIKLFNKKISTAVKQKKRGKARHYDQPVIDALKIIWHSSNNICSKRIVPFLPELISSLERCGHLSVTADVKEKLLSISPATFDRLLHKERIKLKGVICTTKPGALLKNQIKIRTFADWTENRPGFFEVDLVAHCGETVKGTFLNTLVMTDIITTWTECIPLIKKSADDVILGLNTASKLLPFSILGLDVDNGCEFINYELFEYCKQNSITFTRCRAYRKNDQAHVEERNGSIVRRLIGYERYEEQLAWETLSKLYAVLRLYVNFFQPSLKLLDKVRKGAKTIKKYDKAKTPYQRVIASDSIEQEIKQQLTVQYSKLDPVNLLSQIKKLQKQLWALAWKESILSASEKSNQTNGAPGNINNVKIVRPHNWKTRKDPFENVQEFIKLELQNTPNIVAKELLNLLIQKYPGEFYNGHIRTLQRRLSELRKEKDYREQKYQELMIDQKSMTNEDLKCKIEL